MSSYDYGKAEVCDWVRRIFRQDATILDVGPSHGRWRKLLPEYPNMDAVEVFKPNFDLLQGYRQKFLSDIFGFQYEHYDLIIFGDVIEHMHVEQAQTVLEYAWQRCKDMIISVPFLYPQGAEYGNPYEVHVQDDLTAELFAQRYPKYDVLCNPGHNYCYYHKGADA